MAPTQIHDEIRAALAVLRAARFDGHCELIDAAETHLNSLLDRLELVPA